MEGECRRAITMVGLEPAIGFLHDFSDYQTKESLVYDLQEPYRWLGDITVMHAFESGVLDLEDFYFTGDDYHYRFERDAKKRFLRLLLDRINSGARYDGRVLKWDTIIQRKTQDLARFLTSRSSAVRFDDPAPKLERQDSRKIRGQILRFSQKQAREIGISKSTLHYLRKHARNDRSFKVYSKIRERLIRM